jgi:2-keto-4-pentenoate hydratase/2-oxohepta-3-ene-1,7-dioic acid hydratase in catechol pathway
MRLVTYKHGESELVGAIAPGGDVIDITVAGLPTTMIELLALPDGIEAARKFCESANVTLPISEVQLRAPVPRPGKVLAIGLNYRDHAEESGQPIPQRPVVFAKANTCIVGPGDAILMPRVSRAVDWEAELCFVIGKRARYVKAADAAPYIAGYTIGNDVSVRDWQFHSPTWMMGKSFDTHGPFGPWLVTADEVGDPHALDIRTWVNGELRQQSNTRHLIHDCFALVELLSTVCTLEPGDVVATGTPSGVGMLMDPPRLLRAGDVVRVEIERIGAIENRVVDEPSPALHEGGVA